MTEEKTYKQMQTSFTAQFYNYIVPKLKKYEYERFIRILIIIGLSVLVIIIGISILPINQSLTCNKYSRELGLAIASFIAPFYIYSFFKKSFERGIKKKIMPIICNCFPNLEWTTGAYNANFIFKNSYLIDNYDSTSFDDIFKGQFKNVNFDIVKGEFIKNYFTRFETIVFKGVIVKLDFNKKFIGHTVIRPNSMLPLSFSDDLQYTKFEDAEFEKQFGVFTDDEIEAHDLITSSFMKQLDEIKVAFKVDYISCAFYEKHLLIALSTSKDLFSICSLFKKIDDPKQFFTMFEEILSIIKLIDHFKLNQKIGL